jgi:hypothetical protein
MSYTNIKDLFPNVNLKSVSANEIKNIMTSLKPKNSSGYDGISTAKNKFPLYYKVCRRRNRGASARGACAGDSSAGTSDGLL